MSRLRRHYENNMTYFVTCVTYRRRPLLIANRDLFWRAFAEVRQEIPMELGPWVMLPDHFHVLLTPGGNTLSEFMRRLKVLVSARYRQREQVRSGRFWQHRFWDHIIRNDADMQWHVDYMYYNPLKHGLVKSDDRWENSSFATERGRQEPATRPRLEAG